MELDFWDDGVRMLLIPLPNKNKDNIRITTISELWNLPQITEQTKKHSFKKSH